MLWLAMTSKTRKKLPDEGRTVSEFDPGPLMVMLLSITSSPLVKLIVPVTAKPMVAPSFASMSAWRREPGPLSFVLVTVMMFARADTAAAQRSAKHIRAGRFKNPPSPRPRRAEAETEILRMLAKRCGD